MFHQCTFTLSELTKGKVIRVKYHSSSSLMVFCTCRLNHIHSSSPQWIHVQNLVYEIKQKLGKYCNSWWICNFWYTVITFSFVVNNYDYSWWATNFIFKLTLECIATNFGFKLALEWIVTSFSFKIILVNSNRLLFQPNLVNSCKILFQN